ncbi:mechanosensitive ion channel protein 6-like [Senna tora]|uniref:Mechanosensitive ion channel protein n=1 Tax=Senna tora TaxID=362788 RepID=A0A834SXI7_9FABA|nr:mechanosensitive ion channel protein 6-like [Senna tora]
MTSASCPSPRGEVIVKIDDADSKSTLPLPSTQSSSKIWRESSYDFWEDDDVMNLKRRDKSFDFKHSSSVSQSNVIPEDPPSKLIGNFLKNQKLSGDMSLDMDLEMDELQHDQHHRNFPPVDESTSVNQFSRELKVSFEEPPSTSADHELNDFIRRRFKESATADEFPKPPQPPHHDHRASTQINSSLPGDAEVVRCTSNASFERNLSLQRKSGLLLRAKTKSRLIDPPEEPDHRKSERLVKSGQVFSGMQGGGKRGDDEEEDPFLEEDLPDEFKQTHFSIWILLEWLSLISIVAALITTLCIPFLRERNLWKLKLWKWEVMILVLICGRLVSDWVIRIAVFCIERNFLLRKRVLYFVYGVKKAVQNCLWLALVLIAWHFLFDQRVQTETRNVDFLEYVTKILICFLVGTLESLFNQFVIETLSGPPLVELQRQEEEEERLADEVQKLQNAGVTIPPDLRASAFASIATRANKSGMLQKSPHLKSGKFSRPLSKKSDDGISIDHLHKLNHKNVSAWNMKRLMNMVRHGALSTLDEQILGGSTNEDEKATQIRSENEAKAAAKKIFLNVTRRGSRFIYLEDVLRFMREDEAIKTITLFEGATETGKISKSALKNWVVNAFRERRALALTLNDTKTAVNKLHRMLNFVVAIIILVIWLLILEIATSKFLLFVSSQLVLVAFIFGNTCKTIFEAIIFLFVMHPFDVGDRCEIDGVQMVVEEMNILTTVFLRYDNLRIIFPNSVLATKAINNFYRSPDMGDAVEFSVHVSTPFEKISLIKHKLESYVENKKEHWFPAPMIVFKDNDQLNMIRMAIWPTHRMNHQDMGERFIRRSQLIEEMIKIFRETDIHFRLLPLDISVRNMPSTSERLPPSWMLTSTSNN